jgi:hypothetical protein
MYLICQSDSQRILCGRWARLLTSQQFHRRHIRCNHRLDRLDYSKRREHGNHSYGARGGYLDGGGAQYDFWHGEMGVVEIKRIVVVVVALALLAACAPRPEPLPEPAAWVALVVATYEADLRVAQYAYFTARDWPSQPCMTLVDGDGLTAVGEVYGGQAAYP